MPYFSDLPVEVKRRLVHYFEKKPVGTKIKFGESIALDPSHSYVLKNSYIKLEKDIYALAKGTGAILGEGAFGKAKYARSLSSDQVSVIKIIPFKPSDKELDVIGNELIILYDLGLYRDTGARDYGEQTKQYIVMADAGMSLDKYIRLHPKLTASERIDLAIKLCSLIYNLHQGISSRTLHPYAHRDLKPANVALSSTGTMRLIDVGIASDKPDTLPAEFAGAPGYLPNIMTFLESGITLKHLDILALKRMVHMPSKMLCMEGYKEDNTGKHFGLPMLLSLATLKELKILAHFDTSALGPKQSTLKKHQYTGDPLILASLLVLARYGLMETYAASHGEPKARASSPW